MSLVLYPDSDSDRNDDDKAASLAPEASPPRGTSAAKRKRIHVGPPRTSALPPLPAAFHDLYATNTRTSTSDDPSLHGGRKRTVPHIEGNWPSHVYLEWVPSQTESQELYDLLDNVREAIERANHSRRKPLPVPDITPSLRSSLGATLPLHVSLSRTLQIKTDDRDAFLETLSSSMRKAAVRPFHIRFSRLTWVPNYERNRWFLVLAIEKPAQDELNRLLEASNEAAEKCGHPGLYTGGAGDGPTGDNTSNNKPRKRRASPQGLNDKTGSRTSLDCTDNFHVSIAWNLVEPDPEWLTLVRSIDVANYAGLAMRSFDAVKAKIGNTVHNIELASRSAKFAVKGSLLGE